jgi:hypothetical protein
VETPSSLARQGVFDTRRAGDADLYGRPGDRMAAGRLEPEKAGADCQRMGSEKAKACRPHTRFEFAGCGHTI